MDFLSFIRANAATLSDPSMLKAAQIILSAKGLPDSSDPRVLAPALYLEMDEPATRGFQTMMMVYLEMEPANELPKDIKNDKMAFLDAINHVINLQNADPSYTR